MVTIVWRGHVAYRYMVMVLWSMLVSALTLVMWRVSDSRLTVVTGLETALWPVCMTSGTLALLSFCSIRDGR